MPPKLWTALQQGRTCTSVLLSMLQLPVPNSFLIVNEKLLLLKVDKKDAGPLKGGFKRIGGADIRLKDEDIHRFSLERMGSPDS